MSGIKRKMSMLIMAFRHPIKQCEWQCPKCGSRCGGVKGHPLPHQCPTHYKPKKRKKVQ